MSISRTGSCPIYLEYVTRQALVPRVTELTPEFEEITKYNFQWIDIPPYQRGLVWDEEPLEELLESRSVFLGNAVLGVFPIDRDDPKYERIPDLATEYQILVDGLQRFSLGTAILALLHPRVISSEPHSPDLQPLFQGLRTNCGSYAPVYLHNDKELQGHDRTCVSASYREFRRKMERWLDNEFSENRAEHLADKFSHLFLRRQIAPDAYHGFSTPYEVSATFIGLNTVRVQLSHVDWLRSLIVDQGSRSNWSNGEIELIENRFTEVFTKDGKSPETELMPFVAIVKEALEDRGNQGTASRIFKGWPSIALTVDEVEAFLDFVDRMVQHDVDPYSRELRSCGAIPFAGILGYYYRQFLENGSDPSFLSGGETERLEMKNYLKANYRALMNGRIGRTRGHAAELLVSNRSMLEVSEAISLEFLNGTPLSETVDRDWLTATLKQTDKRKAPRVFNACFLPESDSLDFSPQRYGRKAKEYQVDHLYPESAIEQNLPGEPEANLLMNFAPIRRTANNSQSNLSCAQKFAPGGSFSNELENDENAHPILEWLVNEQAQYTSFLDQQAKLQPGQNPPIGDERIGWLTEWLLPRL